MEMNIREIKVRPKEILFKRVAAYARVSVEKESMLHSLAAQISYYTSLIEGNPDWIFAGVYSDEGLTGTKASRAGFQKMLDDCRAKNIDMVIVKSISRFARNTLDLLNVVRELKDLGIDVYFEEQNIHSLSGDGELMLSILASYAQEESRSVSENCKWRYRKAFEHGEGINLEKIYGYRQQDGEIVVSDDAAQVVRRIFDLYIGGTGAKEIARILNGDGIPTATGKRWSESQVRTMLHNEKYTGNSLLQKTFISDHLTKKKRFNRGELPRYYVEDTHPAIIPQATYDAAEKRMAQNREHNGCRPGETWEKHLFTKMIVCPYCGKYFTRKKTKYEVAWVCATYLKQGRDVCRSKKIPEDILEKKAAQVLGTEQVDEAMLRKQVTCIRAYMNNRLTFIMKDGTKTEKTWSDKSRADSWTPEMRMKAAEKAKRGNAPCQEK